MTKKELDDFIAAKIKEVCGPIVTDIVKEFKSKATNNSPIIEAGSPEDRAALAKTQKGLVMSGVIAALANSKMDPERAITYAKNVLKSADVEKALTAGVGGDGGFTIGVEHSDEIIDLLTERAKIRATIANVQDLSAGVAEVSKLTASATTSWGGEIMKIPASQQAFGILVLRARQQKTLVPISNTLLRRGGPRVMNAVRFDTLRAMALGEDTVFLRSPGTEHRPKGVRFWAPAGNVLSATGVPNPTLDQVTGDLGRMVLQLETNHVGMTRPVWVMNPREKQGLASVRIPNGPYAFRDEILSGRLWGFDLVSTTHQPIAGSGLSEVMLYDGDELAIGQGPQLQVALSEDGVIVEHAADGSVQNVISAFQQNMTFMRVISEVDLVARHEEAITVLTGVNWGPGQIPSS